MAHRESGINVKSSRVVTVAASAILVALVGGADAAPAGADQVWHQAIGRPSHDGACPRSTSEELAAGWSEWRPSWGHWMNDGAGGWTCERSITWARESEPQNVNGSGAPGPGTEPAVNCQHVILNYYLDFGAGWALPNGSPVWFNSACLGLPNDTLSQSGGAGFVYAPDGSAQAAARCAEEWPSYPVPVNNGTQVFGCV